MNDSITNILSNPLFGISLTVFTYCLGTIISKRINIQVLNPLIISLILTLLIIRIFNIPTKYYFKGGDVITLFMAPATTILGYSIYNQINLLKKYFLPVIIGCLVGTITSLASVIILSRLFGLNDLMTISLLPKSVTAPIAIEISKSLEGVPSITFISVAITGITGSVFSPLFIKILRIKNSTAAGVAIGTSSHVFGTTKAIEIGEIEGAMSSLSVGIAGVFAVIISIFL